MEAVAQPEETKRVRPFRTVVADPPWPFKDALPGPGRGAGKHYKLMPLEEIRDYLPRLEAEDPRAEMGGDACLWLWVPNAFLNEAWPVAEAWGFRPKTVLTWVKVTKESAVDGRIKSLALRFGMGHYLRNVTEQCLLAVRGRVLRQERNVPNVFFAPRQQHSRKPDAFYEVAERLAPGPYLELFARVEREGWTQLGNGLGSLR